jgi:hypothetical protein
MTADALAQLKRKWTHSFEEDSEQERVYRPSNYPFKRSRGRSEMELKENGEASSFYIGRNDVPEHSTGIWQVTGDELRIRFNNGTTEVFPVKRVDENILVLKK